MPYFPSQQPRWQSQCSPCFHGLPGLPGNIRRWLLESHSLTQCLKQHCEQFRVEVLSEVWQQPTFSESMCLNLKPRRWAFIREVRLYGDNKPWVFARTVMPYHTLTGKDKALMQLGDQPLGEWLFADPRMHRSAFQLAMVKPNQGIYEQANFNPILEPLWGRRSVFFIAGKPLLVSEVFTSEFGFP